MVQKNKKLREELEVEKRRSIMYDKLARWLMKKHNTVWRDWIESD